MEATLPLKEMHQVTRKYAAYSREASGLGNVVGAVFVFISVSFPHKVPLTWEERILLAIFPGLWILAKELLRSRYYQQFGRVAPLSGIGTRIYEALMLLFSIGVSVFCTVLVSMLVNPRPTKLLWTVSLCTFAAIPWVAYRYMRGKYEFITGLYLLYRSAAALGAVVASFPAGVLRWPAAIVAFIMLFAGIEQHRAFLKLRKKLTASGEQKAL